MLVVLTGIVSSAFVVFVGLLIVWGLGLDVAFENIREAFHLRIIIF
jgi:hypothetical protein